MRSSAALGEKLEFEIEVQSHYQIYKSRLRSTVGDDVRIHKAVDARVGMGWRGEGES